MASAISTGIVSLFARFYGRGPTKARTHITDTFALRLMEDVFSTAERTLVQNGHSDKVRETRTAFQDAMREEFIAVVEGATGRKVRAFISQVHLDPELSAELFVFEPDASASEADPES